MEIYKRKVGYEDYGKTPNLIVTATTLYFPFFLKQNFEDIGLYTDTKNPIEETNKIFNGNWNQITNDDLKHSFKRRGEIKQAKKDYISEKVSFQKFKC